MGREDTDASAALRETTLGDDASKLSREPGSYEFWNFYAYEPGFSIGMIFNSSDFTNPAHRRAVREYLQDPANTPMPNPGDYTLLQITVMDGETKIFASLKNASGVTAEFAADRPYGRIGESTFRGVIEDGAKTYYVHIDSPDTDGQKQLEADIKFQTLSPGFTVAGDGIYAGIPGGSSHQWQHVIGYPVTSGTMRVRKVDGEVIFERELSQGGGYCDHLWGRGLLGDVIDAYHCGKLELGPQGSLFFVWLTPRDKAIGEYGYVYRIPKNDQIASLLKISEFVTADSATGAFGLEYSKNLMMKLGSSGQLNVIWGTPPSEDWWFQISGPASFSVCIPDDIDVVDEPGVWSEYFWFPALDDPRYCTLFDFMNR